MSSSSGEYDDLPRGASPQPVPLPHFPNRLHAVVWRNWDVVDVRILAEVLKGGVRDLEEIAFSMGLPPQRAIPAEELRRNYMTVLHRNWHLLPYEQICRILSWSAEKMDFSLKEDDFMWAKLGGGKPTCRPVHYERPGAGVRARAEEISAVLAKKIGTALKQTAEPPFGFIDRFSSASGSRGSETVQAFPFRMVYPYFLRYGDPLLGNGVSDIPEGYLSALAECGVNAIWLQGVLRSLAPWHLAPELSCGWEERLRNLNLLVERCRKFDIDVLIYLNEPRGMPPEFFVKHPELRGVDEMPSRRAYNPELQALCTSTTEVQDFLVNSVRHLFSEVSGLGGVLALTYSENLTNCYSRTYPERSAAGDEVAFAHDPTSTDIRNQSAEPCPRCLQKGPAAVNAEVCTLLERGMREAGSRGRFLLYLWSTPETWVPDILDNLPKSTEVICISEWGTPFVRGDYHGVVNEYSISVVGPSDQSLRQWGQARARGLKTVAKMQAGNTFEFSSIPYIPAMRLVAEHLANLVQSGVDGLMLGWTAGGSPSPNLELVSEFARSPQSTPQEAMHKVASRRFGPAATEVVRAWNLLSDAYMEFPFDVNVCYAGPQSLGPANLLYAQPTGARATMVTFPFDDLTTWRGPYSVETFEKQFSKTARAWKKGVRLLASLRQQFPSPALEEEWRIASAAELHFRSTVNQIQFIRWRDSEPAKCHNILQSEIRLARQLMALVAKDSRIGFEATNHYGYIRHDLAEKILNCEHLLSKMGPERPSGDLSPNC